MNSRKNFNDILDLLWGYGGQTELARISGRTGRTISKYATGEIRVPLRIWVILAEQCAKRKGDIEGAQWIIEAQLNAGSKEKETGNG